MPEDEADGKSTIELREIGCSDGQSDRTPGNGVEHVVLGVTLSDARTLCQSHISNQQPRFL
jgi:hypothetical protein